MSVSDTGPNVTGDTDGESKALSRELQNGMREIVRQAARSLEFEHAWQERGKLLVAFGSSTPDEAWQLSPST
jgi:hypothetical protein